MVQQLSEVCDIYRYQKEKAKVMLHVQVGIVNQQCTRVTSNDCGTPIKL